MSAGHFAPSHLFLHEIYGYKDANSYTPEGKFSQISN